MKKIVISIILIFVGMFYHVSYATEVIATNDIVSNTEKTAENTVINETDSKYKKENTLKEGIQYKGDMYIDTPVNWTEYEVPANSKILVNGWASSNNKGARLVFYIDGKIIIGQMKRTSRGDIDQVISNPRFGGVENTPLAGFEEIIDMSNYKPGTYELKVDQVATTGQVLNSMTRQIKIKQKEYKGDMYIDTPVNWTEYEVPANSKILVNGWASSNNKGARLVFYIDGKIIIGQMKRTSRGDIDQVISNPRFGGVENTPLAGFEEIIDMSNYKPGTYELKVDQVATTGQVLNSMTRQIKIKLKEYKGDMYIDSPVNGSLCELPEVSEIKVNGWASSNDSEARLVFYINDKIEIDKMKRTSRGDIDQVISNPRFGGVENTPLAGFEETIDISKFPAGTYNLKVDQISRYGQVMSSMTVQVNIKQKEYKGDMYMDTPISNTTFNIPEQKNIIMEGWASSDDSKAQISVLVDGKEYPYTVERTSRGDIDQVISIPRFGGTKNTPLAGVKINIDISQGLFEGKHKIVVMQKSRFGKEVSRSEVDINVSTPMYKSNMYVDTPISNKRYESTALEVTGWAMSESENDYICTYVDGEYKTTAGRVSREDILDFFGDQYGGRQTNQNPGFYSLVNTSNLREGKHILTVIHYSAYGKELGQMIVPFIISNTTTWGIDVSHHQGTIDWETVKNQGINFAILKIGEYRESSGRILVDSCFERNYSECKRLGIAVGGYFYSYAFNPAEAVNEANACLSIINGKHFEMPIYFDLEDDIVTNAVKRGTTNKENLTNATITFCNILNSRGYKSGIYSYKNFFNQYLNMAPLENYNVWLAHYVGATDYSGVYDMWQYTSSGSLPGISGRVDMNWCYRKY